MGTVKSTLQLFNGMSALLNRVYGSIIPLPGGSESIRSSVDPAFLDAYFDTAHSEFHRTGAAIKQVGETEKRTAATITSAENKQGKRNSDLRSAGSMADGLPGNMNGLCSGTFAGIDKAAGSGELTNTAFMASGTYDSLPADVIYNPAKAPASGGLPGYGLRFVAESARKPGDSWNKIKTIYSNTKTFPDTRTLANNNAVIRLSLNGRRTNKLIDNPDALKAGDETKSASHKLAPASGGVFGNAAKEPAMLTENRCYIIPINDIKGQSNYADGAKISGSVQTFINLLSNRAGDYAGNGTVRKDAYQTMKAEGYYRAKGLESGFNLIGSIEQENSSVGKCAGYIFDNNAGIEDGADISAEDLKTMRGLAETKSVQNFIKLTPMVTVTTGDIRSETGVDGLVSKIERALSME
ncbi:MAG: hypothetical protein Q8878_09150, partial [Bacillota bacterium]|nr:hypothetical protein [Bacillota bacterium]